MYSPTNNGPSSSQSVTQLYLQGKQYSDVFDNIELQVWRVNDPAAALGAANIAQQLGIGTIVDPCRNQLDHGVADSEVVRLGAEVLDVGTESVQGNGQRQAFRYRAPVSSHERFGSMHTDMSQHSQTRRKRRYGVRRLRVPGFGYLFPRPRWTDARIQRRGRHFDLWRFQRQVQKTRRGDVHVYVLDEGSGRLWEAGKGLSRYVLPEACHLRPLSNSQSPGLESKYGFAYGGVGVQWWAVVDLSILELI
jgi:hypothetical protein